jgi:DNA-binding MarR family transcriptional regulator
MTEPRWLDEREAEMWRALQEASSALDGALERQLAEEGLSAADYALLVPLSEAEGDLLRARELAGRVGWERSRLSHQLRRMEQRGLVERSECSEDARGTMIALTAQGRAALEKAAPGHVAAVRRHFVDLLEPDELPVLTAVFRRVRDALAATRGDGCS